MIPINSASVIRNANSKPYEVINTIKSTLFADIHKKAMSKLYVRTMTWHYISQTKIIQSVIYESRMNRHEYPPQSYRLH